MAEEDPKTVIVEQSKRASTAMIVAVIALFLIALFLIFVLPLIMGGNSVTDVEVTPGTPVPTATE